jgi:hypothetical protein
MIDENQSSIILSFDNCRHLTDDRCRCELLLTLGGLRLMAAWKAW